VIWLLNQLNVMLNAELSVADRECLDAFVRVRHQLAVDMDMSAEDEDALVHYQSNEVEELSTHELLIAEVHSLDIDLSIPALEVVSVVPEAPSRFSLPFY
jgi:hypothetical protein